jgi:predicted nuclease of predicted toxin-antitoxin system
MANKIRFYFDEHMPRAVEKGLGNQGYTVVMAVDVDMIDKDDDTEHLPFATSENAVVVTRDKPFAGRTAKRSDHAGLICWTGADDDFGGMIRALIDFAQKYTPDEVTGQVFWLK